jgi:hypothetical protein
VKNKKILLIGNPCNHSFALSRYLIDHGYQAQLLLFGNEQKIFLPEADRLDNKRPDYVTQTNITHSPTDFFYAKKKTIIQLTKNFDFIIGTGAAPAYLNLINIKIDIFIPSGSDLYFLPFYKTKQLSKVSFKKFIKICYLTYHQRKGIKKSKNILFSYTNKEIEKCLKELRYNGPRIKLASPHIYIKEYEDKKIESFYNKNPTKISREFEKIRSESDFMIFHHCRHSWKNTRNTMDYKGNEKLIEGYSKFIKEKIALSPKLILFNYGHDVDQSKKIIRELKIEKHISWFPVLERREIMYGISLSDVGVAEIGLSWITYSVILEFLCMSKPIITFRDDNLYKNDYDKLYDINNVKDIVDIHKALKNIFRNKNKHIKIARKNFDWFLENGIDRGLNSILKIIEKN